MEEEHKSTILYFPHIHTTHISQLTQAQIKYMINERAYLTKLGDAQDNPPRKTIVTPHIINKSNCWKFGSGLLKQNNTIERRRYDGGFGMGLI